MWSKYLTGYLKRIYKVLLWFLLLTGCFCLVYFLYDLPVSAALYAALLSVACGLLFLIFDFLRYVSHCRKIEFMLSQELPVPEDFPLPFDYLIWRRNTRRLSGKFTGTGLTSRSDPPYNMRI